MAFTEENPKNIECNKENNKLKQPIFRIFLLEDGLLQMACLEFAQ